MTLVLLGSAAAAYRFQGVFIPWIEGKSDSDAVEVSGNIEAHESILSFKTVQSRIVELPFDEGQRVTAGTVLARVEDSALSYRFPSDPAGSGAAGLSATQAGGGRGRVV